MALAIIYPKQYSIYLRGTIYIGGHIYGDYFAGQGSI